MRVGLLDQIRLLRGAADIRGADSPERMCDARQAAQYGVWLLSEITEAIGDPRPSIANNEVKQHFAKKRAALRKLLATGRRQGTRDHDVSQNIAALPRHIAARADACRRSACARFGLRSQFANMGHVTHPAMRISSSRSVATPIVVPS